MRLFKNCEVDVPMKLSVMDWTNKTDVDNVIQSFDGGYLCNLNIEI